ncbi:MULTISPECIES: NAD-dependent epimerase/dehydratase family protein [Sphingobium]|uniref:NAD-dependent epimerase/dehydratase family protein n=1 Tax=Sphingobium TaxID=165695 RepID=UPI00159C3E90|nr:SDR family oxidoreductase [Sphingobium sp. 15-1]
MVDIDYLLTGGAGFIGCALSASLLRGEGGKTLPSIIAVDSLHPQVHLVGNRPASLPDAVDLRIMDICDAAAWDALFKEVRPRTIIHLAAETGTGQSLDLPVRHTHTNLTGTAEMLEALHRAGQVPDHIVLSSSRAVYGEGAWTDPADGRIFQPGRRESAALERGDFAVAAPSGLLATPVTLHHARVQPAPSSIYGVTKLAQEQILSNWCAARNVSLTTLRLQNVYGVGQSPHNPYTGIIVLFHRLAAAGKRIEVYEDGEMGRDFIYIDDVVQTMTKAIERPPEVSRTMDIGSGAVKTILEAAQQIACLYGAPEPEITGVFRYGDIRWAVCDPADMQEQFEVTPTVDFLEGNERLSQWLCETDIIAA